MAVPWSIWVAYMVVFVGVVHVGDMFVAPAWIDRLG